MPATTLLHSEAASISSSLFLFSSFATSTSSLFEPKAFGEKYFERFAFCSAELHFAALCCKLARSLAQQLSRSLTARVVRHTLMCFVLSLALAVVAFSQIFRLSFSSQGRNYSQKKECKKYISLSFPALCVYIAASRKLAWRQKQCTLTRKELTLLLILLSNSGSQMPGDILVDATRGINIAALLLLPNTQKTWLGFYGAAALFISFRFYLYYPQTPACKKTKNTPKSSWGEWLRRLALRCSKPNDTKEQITSFECCCISF